MSETKPFRPWVAWTIGSIWLGTAILILVSTRIHPPTTANASLSVRGVSFRTNARHILGVSDEEQLLITGVDTLQIQLGSPQTVYSGNSQFRAATVNVKGDSSATCSFYLVRSSGVELSGPSVISLGVPETPGEKSFHLKVHGSISGNLTSQPRQHGLIPGLMCTRVQVNGAPASNMEVRFSLAGGDSAFFVTHSDARLDFDLNSQSQIGDTQIPIFQQVRFSDIDPLTSEEKTVLLKPPSGYKNEVSFEKLDKIVSLDDADLLIIVPRSDFYLRRFLVKDGIQLSMHGTVSDVRAGAGASDLQTRMPSLADQLDNKKRLFGLIPALATLILGILEKLGILQRDQKGE